VFKINQNNSERILRFLISIILVPCPFILGISFYSMFLAIVGIILLFNAVTGTCYTYMVLGINTCEVDKE